MADEQAQVEETTEDEAQATSEGNENEQASSEENISEDEKTPTSEKAGGDLSVALRQEREKRQALEARLSDPQFVYQQAKALGLTEEEAQEEAAQASTPSVNQPPYDVSKQVQFELDKERTMEKYPELSKDEEAQIAISAIAQAKGIPLSKAAGNYFAKIGKVSSEAVAQGAAAKEAEITAKERAATTPQTGGNISSDKSEEERLVAQSKSLDPCKQMKALQELEIRRMRAS